MEDLRYWAWLLKVSFVSINQAKEISFFYHSEAHLSPHGMSVLGKLHAIGGSGCTPSLKHVLKNPVLTAVNTQLHNPFHSV